MKNLLRNRKKIRIEYSGKKWICGVAIDFEETPCLICPESLRELLKANNDFEKFRNIDNYDNGLWFIPDKDLYQNIDSIQSFMESYSPYWFADDWNGVIPVIKLSELNS